MIIISGKCVNNERRLSITSCTAQHNLPTPVHLGGVLSFKSQLAHPAMTNVIGQCTIKPRQLSIASRAAY